MRVGALAFDLESLEVFVNDKLLLAPKLELMLLGALMRRAGRAVTREALLEEIYGATTKPMSTP